MFIRVQIKSICTINMIAQRKDSMLQVTEEVEDNIVRSDDSIYAVERIACPFLAR
jgi:hypothetical protein